MDRPVKERLVGAAILMLLAVLIVPELLSGPKHQTTLPPQQANPAEPTRNVTVDLSTSKASAAEPPDSAAAPPVDGALPSAASAIRQPESSRPSEPSAPASPPHSASAPTVTTLQAQQPPATAALENTDSAPNSAESTARPAASRSATLHDEARPGTAHPRWAAQVGSFASRANAEKLQRLLKAQSFSAYIVPSGTGKSLLYRVRVGPMADRAAAEKAIARLRQEGHAASVVAP